jgi:hypothetical protein
VRDALATRRSTRTSLPTGQTRLGFICGARSDPEDRRSAPGPRFRGRGRGGHYPPWPVPVQRAPRRPVVMPAGRSPGAARERGVRFAAPAGTAPHPAIVTSRDDALGR